MQSFGFLDIPALLGEFHGRHPDVEILVRPSAGGSVALVDELKRGGTDLAFVSLIEDPVGVSTTELGVEDLYVVGGARLLPPGRAAVKLSALSEATFVDFPTGWGIRAAVDHAFATAAVNRRVNIEIADVNTLLHLLHAELGIALLPRSLLSGGQQLQTRRLASPLSWRVVMALPSNRPIRAAARAFAELVASSRPNA
jgi:DNA-binding transcriptional LysR family regulator